MMSKETSVSRKRKQVEDGIRGNAPRPKKRTRKQRDYHSSTEESEAEEGFAPVNSLDSDDEAFSHPQQRSGKRIEFTNPESTTTKPKGAIGSREGEEDAVRGDDGRSDEREGTDDDDQSEADTTKLSTRKAPSKRNDPEAFSNSISKILSTKLSKTARDDPVLSRSRDATEASTSLAEERLERKVKAKIRAEKKEALERGRITDALGVATGEAGEVKAEEQRLRKIAQRGVTRMFNAVRAAQVKAEQAAREERKKGTVGTANREEKINEMSKQGFLDLISRKKEKTAEGS